MLALRVRVPVAVDPAADDLAARPDEVAEVGGDDVPAGPAGDVVAAPVVLDRDPVVAGARIDTVGALAAEQDVGAVRPGDRGARCRGRNRRQGHEEEDDRDATPHDPHGTCSALGYIQASDRPQTSESGHLRG